MSEGEDYDDPRAQAADDEHRRRELMQRVDLGIQTQAFLDSKIGQTILTDCEQELKELNNEVFTLNPEIPTELAQLKRIIFRGSVLRHWQDKFGEYITSGRNAEHELEGIG